MSYVLKVFVNARSVGESNVLPRVLPRCTLLTPVGNFFFSTRSFNEIIVTEKPNPGSFAIFLRSSLLTDQSGLRKFVKYIIKALLMINKLILIFY